MTDKDRKQPTPTQHDQGLRQRFEQELAQLQKQHGTPAEAAAFPGGNLLHLILGALSDPSVREWLWGLWQQAHGGGDNPTPPTPPTPPEPST